MASENGIPKKSFMPHGWHESDEGTILFLKISMEEIIAQRKLI